MKAKNSLKTLLFFICLVSFVSCEKNEDENESKETGYQEYILTVASQKLQGIVGIGVNVLTDVYAVKKDKSQEWKQFAVLVDSPDVHGTCRALCHHHGGGYGVQDDGQAGAAGRAETLPALGRVDCPLLVVPSGRHGHGR